MEICEELYVHSLLTRTFLPLQDFREADTIKVTHFSVVPALLHLGKNATIGYSSYRWLPFCNYFSKERRSIRTSKKCALNKQFCNFLIYFTTFFIENFLLGTHNQQSQMTILHQIEFLQLHS